MAISVFIPTIWSARLLEHLDKAHVYAGLVNRDYEGEIRNYGDTVKIQQIGDITVKDYTKNTDIAAPEAIDGTTQSLVIDQAKYFNFAIDDVDAAQVNPKLMDKAMRRAAYKLNDTTDQFLAGLMAAGAVNVTGHTELGADTTPIVPTAASAYDKLVELKVDLDEKNVPTAGRWVVIPPWFHGMLLKDSRFVGNGTDYNKAILEGGEVGTAAGFRVFLSNNVPNTSKAKYKIIAGTDEGCTYAEQILETEAYRPEKRFSDAIKGLHVYGSKVTQGACLSVLTANKSA